ncbi:DEAD/DEAH box helicase [Rhodopseudomonas palustris]|uniref:DEAD/DEAH box helicase n=1 Tax=Rhodopseudomonas palustris TaxID=1076 RepID=UPI0006420183|nr:ATP-binding domain-containing protein [Rhodopseudomonas palustris]QDL98832.1 helicase [Rhodopseudomonas palustris]
MVEVIWGSSSKPASSRRLAEILEAADDLEGTLYIGYPILGTPSGAFPIDATLLSPEHGIIVFDVVEGRDPTDFQQRQDEIYTKVKSRLMQFPNLVQRRELGVELTVATFAPATLVKRFDVGPDYHLLDSASLRDFIPTISWENKQLYPALASAIQSLSTIRRGKKKRESARPDSRGAKLRRLEETIANLDVNQGAAVIETVPGVQRIRGLAGSGKTIVLALKVAYLHAQNPEWNIAVTFNTRSLKGQFERLITNFVYEQTSEEPDWDKIEIVNAWGAPGSSDRTGIYYKFCRANGTTYFDFKSAQERFPGKEFQGACSLALKEAINPQPFYDAILVDEAQDFPPEFLRLCYRFLKEPKRLVYAYDELQNLTNASMLPPEDIFGRDSQNRPLVSLTNSSSGEPRQDIILEKCYRNSRPILATAHALGFGIYRTAGLVQFFDQHDLWLDVGYEIKTGSLSDDQRVSLHRTDRTSPRFLESHSPIDDIISFKCFETTEAQDEWLAGEIEKNLKEDDLLPEDIVVINPDPLKTRKAVARARSLLFKKEINSTLAGVSSSPDVFFENDAITFTGIFRAKGNEAAMVYIINANDCYDSYFPVLRARIRSQLFTAITRSKAWVRVLGVGADMKTLAREFETIKQNDFCLNFQYPNEQKRKELHIINRDMTHDEKKSLVRNISDLGRILDEIDLGTVTLEDLPQDIQSKLQKIIGKMV